MDGSRSSDKPTSVNPRAPRGARAICARMRARLEVNLWQGDSRLGMLLFLAGAMSNPKRSAFPRPASDVSIGRTFFYRANLCFEKPNDS